MFYLGLIVSVCYVPGYTGASIPTQWVVLSAILPFTLWQTTAVGPALDWCPRILAFAALSILWSVSKLDAGYGLWLLCIWLLCFRLGTTNIDLPSLCRGLAIGLSVSSGIAILQWLGHDLTLPTNQGLYPSGLLYNPTVLGCCSALTILGLIEYRQWWYIPALLPGLALCHSRGAWLVLVVSLIFRYINIVIALALLTIASLVFTYFLIPADAERLTIWGVAISKLTIFGNGIGSFNSLYYIIPTPIPSLTHPEFAHNDYLQLWFELGIFAILIYIIFAIALIQRHAALIGFALFSTFYFPLWCPIPSFIGCILAGRGVRDWYLRSNPSIIRGFDILSRYAYAQCRVNSSSRTDIPALP